MNQYALDILSCPTDPSASGSTMYITYTSPTKLSIVKGADETLTYDLKDFYAPVNSAQKTTFTLPAHAIAYMPVDHTSFDYCGMNANGNSIFASFFPQYTANDDTTHFIEWAFASELEGALQAVSPIDLSTYDLKGAMHISPVIGSYVGYSSILAYLICSGGLKIWSSSDGTKLFNTLNSNIASNVTYAAVADYNGTMWIGTDSGLCKLVYSNPDYIFTTYNISNSDISSNIVNNVQTYGSKIILSTDKGISIFDSETLLWKNYNKMTVNSIRGDQFYGTAVSDAYLLSVSDGGVNVLNQTLNTWKRYDSSTTGWSGSNIALSITAVNGEVFVGTVDNLYTFTIDSDTVYPISGPQVGAASINYDILTDKLYVGYLNGYMGRYDIDTTTWDFNTQISSDISFLGPDLLFCDSEGYASVQSDGTNVQRLPGSDENGDILFVYPSDKIGNIALGQDIYIGLSKSSTLTSFIDHFTGLTVSASSLNSGHLMKASSTFDYATSYSFKITEGLTAADSTYFKQVIDVNFYTEEKTPVNGFHPLGTQLTMAGTTAHPIESLVFRNPQTVSIDIVAIVAS